jgi:hypothetical protein
MKKLLELFIWLWLTIGLLACERPPRHVDRAFYYWKTEGYSFNDNERKFLDTLRVKKIYVRFFDVSYNEVQGPVPVGELDYLGHRAVSGREIVPTVFITNFTFAKLGREQVPDLAQKVTRKITHMIRGEDKEPLLTLRELQLDCDWTATTKEKFFLFCLEMKKLNPRVKISATIRLYQYKYYQKAGVPPVDRGMLMFYNLTDLRNPKAKNTILDLEEAKKYLTHDDYPLKLDIALPIFSWASVFREGQYVDVYRNLTAQQANALTFLKKAGENLYDCQTDTVYERFYLREGDRLRIEEVSEAQLRESAALLRDIAHSDSASITFFHLDKNLIDRYRHETFEQVYAAF